MRWGAVLQSALSLLGVALSVAQLTPELLQRCGLDAVPSQPWEYDEWLAQAYITAVQANCTVMRHVSLGNAGIGAEMCAHPQCLFLGERRRGPR